MLELGIEQMGECWADVEWRSVDDQGLGPLKVWGFGSISADGIWKNIGNWPGWDSADTDGYAAQLSGRDDKTGEPIYRPATTRRGKMWWPRPCTCKTIRTRMCRATASCSCPSTSHPKMALMRAVIIASSIKTSLPVWKSKFYGARRGRDALIDFHTGYY